MYQFIKQHILLFTLVGLTAVIVVMNILSNSSEGSECDRPECHVSSDPPFPEEWRDYGSDKTMKISTDSNSIDISKYAFVMPVSVGTRWVYEGKRLFYDRAQEINREVIAQKIVEIINIAETEQGLRVDTKETYTNDPDFTERKKSYLVSEAGFDFGTGEISSFPLVEGQEVRSVIPDTDNLYPTKVSKVHPVDSFGNNTPCYDIDDSTSSDTSFTTFCEGVGYVRDYYEHNGTPDESDYLLVRTIDPKRPVCPDDFKTSEEQVQAINNWTNQFFDKNPEGTMLDWVDARLGFFQENNCVEALQRLKDAENGNADPETMEAIDEVVDELISQTNN